MIKLVSKGNWDKTYHFLKNASLRHKFPKLVQFGKQGVEILSSATPVDSGETAAAWRYEIQEDREGVTISFHNDNINKDVNIAIILQYGHGTGTGGWVEGRDYINPAIQPVFDEMAETMWREVMDE